MTIPLPSHHERHADSDLGAFVRRKVRSGRYRDAGEVMREALRLLEQREQAFEPAVDDLEAKLLAGLDSPKTKLTPTFFSDIRKRGLQRLKKAAA